MYMRYGKIISGYVIIVSILTPTRGVNLVLGLEFGEPFSVETASAFSRHLILAHTVAVVQVALGPLAQAGGDLLDRLLRVLAQTGVRLALVRAADGDHVPVPLASCLIQTIALLRS